jgi:hypothetical protein
MLGYGIAHFAVYIVAVLIGSRWGLTGVSIASVSSHAVFLVVAYQVMLHGRGEPVLRFLWQDLRAGAVGAAAMAAVAVPVDIAVGDAGVPAFLHLAIVGAVAGVVYLLALWRLFPSAWTDVAALLRRVLPSGPVRRITARVPALAGRSS